MLTAILLFPSLLSAAPAAPAPRVKVLYWEKWTGNEREAIQSLVDEFNRSQERITVEMVLTSGIDQKTLVATAGGVPPDIAGVWEHTIVPYADKNALTPLDEFLPGSGIGPETYIPAIWQLCQYQGKTWALVAQPSVVALHYNRRLFREAGMDPDRPPHTLAELDQFAKRLTHFDKATGKYTQLGFLPVDPGWWHYGWGYFFGAELWDGKGKITADSPENLRAMEWIRSYVDEYGAAPLQVFRSNFGINYSMSQNPFMSGTLAMQEQGSYLGNFITEFAPGLDWGAAPMPVLHEGDPPTTLVNCDVLVIPKGAKHPKEAFEFMAWLNRQENMERLSLGQQKISPLRLVSEHFYATHKNPYIRMFQQLAWSPRAVGVPKMGIFREFHKEMDAAVDAVWTGAQTPKEALAQVQQRIQHSLDRELEVRRHPSSTALKYLPLALCAFLALLLAAAVLIKERRERAHTKGSRQRHTLLRGLAFA
ncbi:MAG: ABC transporter substrate-binding protein, partial [candidate division FCPU426 bacterium]